VIRKPAVSLIMPISLDHESYLGDRVELIAAEKAGIIKRGCPVVIGAPEDAAREVLVRPPSACAVPLLVYGQDFVAYEEHGRMVYQDETGLIDIAPPRLLGPATSSPMRRPPSRPCARPVSRFRNGRRRCGNDARLMAGPHAAAAARQAVGACAAAGCGSLDRRRPQSRRGAVVVAEAMAELEERNPRPLF
jgi:dihydrofolate synthase/folylpolyglutamate synthase